MRNYETRPIRSTLFLEMNATRFSSRGRDRCLARGCDRGLGLDRCKYILLFS